MTTKKVLIITYYWPPSGGSGVQRWVKFVKYLREFGWEPVIYTPEDPEFPAIDNTLENDLPDDLEVIKRPIQEPYRFYKKLVGMKEDQKIGAGLMKEEGTSGLMHKLSVWIRGNFFIPDARKWWIRPSVRFLRSYLEEHPVDVMVTTGPPHSMHMIGHKVKEQTGIPWLADFRDPWTNIDFFQDLHLSRYARRKHKRMEQSVLDRADILTVVSPTMKREYAEITDTELHVITNGFDRADFPDSDEKPPKDHFVLTHIGMMGPSRNPEVLWKALQDLKDNHPESAQRFKLQLIGKVDESVGQSIRSYGLQDLCEIRAYIPHDEIIREQKRSTALLLIINESPNADLLLPGKLFEYLASGRPVICLTPVEGDAAAVIRETGAGKVIMSNNASGLSSHLNTLISEAAKTEKQFSARAKEAVEQYSRKALTGSLAELLNQLSQ